MRALPSLSLEQVRYLSVEQWDTFSAVGQIFGLQARLDRISGIGLAMSDDPGARSAKQEIADQLIALRSRGLQPAKEASIIGTAEKPADFTDTQLSDMGFARGKPPT